ncbi:MAG: class II aldolase/adducin family protein [Treponema sp.]|jgi:L-ribulose-5-phosphate 4-epimerase|nr:class II aldolase/adducin family protein [Treponema sp.]
MLYEELRKEVYAMNMALFTERLVVWTGGNVSGLVRDAGHIVIKPSGVPFGSLSPENMVVTDMEGTVVEGELAPSVDLPVHIYIYKHRPDVRGIAHTHSPYAASFALLGQSIPAALSPIAHLLGADIPCSRYAQAAYEDTGAAIIETAGKDGLAVLVNRHGVFTMGKSATESVKIAAQVEEAAQTIHYAMLRGKVEPMSKDEVKRCYDFYHANYGQDKR